MIKLKWLFSQEKRKEKNTQTIITSGKIFIIIIIIIFVS